MLPLSHPCPERDPRLDDPFCGMVLTCLPISQAASRPNMVFIFSDDHAVRRWGLRLKVNRTRSIVWLMKAPYMSIPSVPTPLRSFMPASSLVPVTSMGSSEMGIDLTELKPPFLKSSANLDTTRL